MNDDLGIFGKILESGVRTFEELRNVISPPRGTYVDPRTGRLTLLPTEVNPTLLVIAVVIVVILLVRK